MPNPSISGYPLVVEKNSRKLVLLLGINRLGLVEAAYIWYMELRSGMEEIGWIRGNIDSSVWRKRTPSGPIYVPVQVDNGVMGGFEVAENKAIYLLKCCHMRSVRSVVDGWALCQAGAREQILLPDTYRPSRTQHIARPRPNVTGG
jgi:hypothetical protein